MIIEIKKLEQKFELNNKVIINFTLDYIRDNEICRDEKTFESKYHYLDNDIRTTLRKFQDKLNTFWLDLEIKNNIND